MSVFAADGNLNLRGMTQARDSQLMEAMCVGNTVSFSMSHERLQKADECVNAGLLGVCTVTWVARQAVIAGKKPGIVRAKTSCLLFIQG